MTNPRSKIKTKWARQDSNLGPRDYESPALTAELQARMRANARTSNTQCPTSNSKGSSSAFSKCCQLSELIADNFSKPRGVSVRSQLWIQEDRTTHHRMELCKHVRSA